MHKYIFNIIVFYYYILYCWGGGFVGVFFTFQFQQICYFCSMQNFLILAFWIMQYTPPQTE